ncbi:MAG: hypothetical protein AAF579_10675 [Cyanobacteria bacterium P01_C01_bin.118]
MNVLKLLLNPIFLLAAGLHAGLLLIPVAGGSSDEIVPAPDPEGESITVTRIPPKQTQPKSPGTGQTASARTNRPATATTAKTTGGTKTATGGTNQQQKVQGSGRSQDQSATGENNRSDNSRRNDNQSNQTARDSNNNPPGLPDLPPENNTDENVSSVPVTTVPAETVPTLTALKDGVSNQVPTMLSAFLASLRYSFGETQDVAVEQAKQKWLEQLADLPEVEGSDPQELEKTLDISYPIVSGKNGSRNIRRCLTPKPTQGLVGVVVDKNGLMGVDDNDENTAAPVLLRSSGYQFLNELALDSLADYTDFPDVSVPQAYIVPVNIDYNQETCMNWARLIGSETGAETTAENDQ